MTASRETGPKSRVNKGLYVWKFCINRKFGLLFEYLYQYKYQIIRTHVNRVSAENMVVYYGCPMCGAVV